MHAIHKGANDAALDLSQEAKKQRMVAAAPSWLKERVQSGEELPFVEIRRQENRSRKRKFQSVEYD